MAPLRGLYRKSYLSLWIRYPRFFRIACVLTIWSLRSVIVPVGVARAENRDARKHYDEATAAFGLGHYADAAAEYEAAFRLRPDPALLYNCAQSYRLAGNKVRALELYRNYLRLYGEALNADDARKHLSDLEFQVAAEKRVSADGEPVLAPPQKSASMPQSHPLAPVPVVGPGDKGGSPWVVALPPPMPAPPRPAPAGTLDLAPVYIAPQSSIDTGPPSMVRRPWFWVAVGTALIGGTVFVLAATRADRDPSASLGRVSGN